MALVIGAWPFHGVVAGCAMRSHSRVHGCLFFCGSVECAVRPLFRILPTGPNIARLASRPRGGGRGYRDWNLAVTGRCRLTLCLTRNLNDKGCTATNIGSLLRVTHDRI
jgi:hypothetical protein